MGCCMKNNKVNKIQIIKTSNNITVFTSTSNIHQIYSFGKMIGLGVYGKVLVARQNGNDDKLFAIKVIDKQKIFGKETDLANEIYALKKLDHPNILKFYEVYQNDLYFYICTELCQGGDLIERIPKFTVCYTEKQCARMASKILSAMAYMHEQGFLHRDIKPENIMLSSKDLNSEPKIIDFGLAVKLEDIQNRHGNLSCVGTPLYVAPEVTEGFYTDKCDVWSFGVMLYQMLCGYPPFYGANKKELFQHIKNQDVVFERRHWNNVTPQAKEFVKKLLIKNPFLRPSAKECLKHPWFNVKFDGQQNIRRRTYRAPTRKIVPEEFIEDQRTIYDMLKSYRNGATFKKEVMKVLINQMNEKELEHLKSVFQKIDEDNSGTITYIELQKALLQEGSQVPHDEIKQLMLAIGMDKDDDTEDCSSIKSYKPLVIKYSDFLTACIDERKVLTKEKLLSLFKYFDHTNKCYITKENIKEAFARHGRALSDEKIDEMIFEIDPNHDNKISFEEFCMMMIEEGVSQVIDFKENISYQQVQ